MKTTLRTTKGFTMIEMMIVLAIIGIILGIAIPQISKAIQNARLTSCKASLKGIETALEFFYNENERYPSDDEALMELVRKGKLRRDQMLDPWKNNWDYKAVDSEGGAKGQRYYLRSIGADSKRATVDDLNSANFPWPVEEDAAAKPTAN